MIRIPLLVLLALAPVASAGVTFGGGLLEVREGCASGGSYEEWWSGGEENGTRYAYGSASATSYDGCHSTRDDATLAVHANGHSVVSARSSYSDNHSATASSARSWWYSAENDSASYGESWQQHDASSGATGRRVDASAPLVAAGASDGCSRDDASSYRGSRSGGGGEWNGTRYGHEWAENSQSWSHGRNCGTGAAAESDVTTAGASTGNRCQSTGSGSWQRSEGAAGNESYGYASGEWADSSRCTSGPEARVGNARLHAGSTTACDARSQGSSSWNGNATWGSWSESQECESRLGVSGPTGFAAYRRDWSHHDETCDAEGGCYSITDAYRALVVYHPYTGEIAFPLP